MPNVNSATVLFSLIIFNWGIEFKLEPSTVISVVKWHHFPWIYRLYNSVCHNSSEIANVHQVSIVMLIIELYHK